VGPRRIRLQQPEPRAARRRSRYRRSRRGIEGSGPRRPLRDGRALRRGLRRPTVCRSAPKGGSRNGLGGSLYPDEFGVIERVAPKLAAFQDAALRAEVTRLHQCPAELRSGALKRGTPEFERCTTWPLPAAFSRLTMLFARLNADPARLVTQASAIENVSQSAREVINLQRNYGDMPLIVLTAGRRPLPLGMPADVREQAALFSGRYGPGRTPTLRCPHADTTSSSRIPGMLSSSRIMRWFSPRSTACWQRSGRSRLKNRRSTNRLISTNAFGLRKKHSLSRHGSDFGFTSGKSDGSNRRRQNLAH
jgi:hypothetical protein